MYKSIVLVGLTTAAMLSGCLVRKDEPVAQQKNIGRILDAAFQGKKGLQSLGYYASRVSDIVKRAHTGGLREDQLRELAAAVVSGGSKAINNFKKTGISKVFDEFVATSAEMTQRVQKKIDALPPPVKSELETKFAVGGVDHTEAAAFLKQHTDIADDKIFARLVEQQGKNLDDFAEAAATNHRLADAVGVELASDSAYGLKRLDISAEQMASELKVSTVDFHLGEIVFSTSKGASSGYRFIQELSGVDVYNEAYALHLLLHHGGDGKFAYQTLSAEEIKKLGNPFDKRFTKPVLSGKYDKNWSSGYLRQFYETD